MLYSLILQAKENLSCTDENEISIGRWRHKNSETSSYLFRVLQQLVLWELRLESKALGLWCFFAMRTSRLLDFWPNVLWGNGPWAWLSQGSGVAVESWVVPTGSGLWGGDVTRGEGLWVCAGVERWGIVARQIIPCLSYLGDGGMKRFWMIPRLGRVWIPILHGVPGLEGGILFLLLIFFLCIWFSPQHQDASSLQSSPLFPLLQEGICLWISLPWLASVSASDSGTWRTGPKWNKVHVHLLISW